MDALQYPYSQLFTVARQALGNNCKYLASCGFSFGDDHINQNLLAPALNGGKVTLFAFCAAETDGLSSLKSLPAFNAGFAAGGISSGLPHDTGTDFWKFSQFVNVFE